MHDARNNSGHMHDAQALAMHDACNEKNAMHVHTMCKNSMIGARKKGMGTLNDNFRLYLSSTIDIGDLGSQWTNIYLFFINLCYLHYCISQLSYV